METNGRMSTGDIVDDFFAIQEYLGGGAQAEVYAAYDLALDREVALKISLPAMDAKHLRNEGRLLSSLRHPGVVAAHSIGNHDGRVYLVLERLFGSTLEDHLELRGRHRGYAVDDAVEILAQLAEALSVLHRMGVIHRDLKPGNIMIAPGGRVVLFDLGAGLGGRAAVSSDVVIGTPCYIAPELLGVPPAAPAPTQDIYALGCIAFELLAARVPFDGPTSREILLGHLERPAPPLPERVNARPLLAQLISRMLAKDPAERPQSVELIAGWLRGIQRGSLEAQRASATEVLIADDDEDVRALLATIIERRIDNVSVSTAKDGREALWRIVDSPPDVLLLDLEMPHRNGIDVCMHLSSMPEAGRVTVCAVSGRADVEDRALLSRLGVGHFIDKAWSPNEIVAIVEKVVDQAEARKRLAQ